MHKMRKSCICSRVGKQEQDIKLEKRMNLNECVCAQALGAGNKYHKLCLKCIECGKLLSSTNMVDKDFDLYCRSCYTKLHGPKVNFSTVIYNRVINSSSSQLYFRVGSRLFPKCCYMIDVYILDAGYNDLTCIKNY